MNPIEALKRGEEKARISFYDRHKAEFLRFARKYDLIHEELIEVYQDACLVVFENAVKGKLDHLKSSLKTYLFGVGKYLIYKRFKTNEKLQNLRIVEEYQESFFDPFELNDREEQLSRISLGLRHLGKKCRALLQYFYFEEKDLDEIMIIMDYASKDVLKSQKSRCVKQLKEIIQKNG